eukprot:2230055-Rhodomonas_salina.1
MAAMVALQMEWWAAVRLRYTRAPWTMAHCVLINVSEVGVHWERPAHKLHRSSQGGGERAKRWGGGARAKRGGRMRNLASEESAAS